MQVLCTLSSLLALRGKFSSLTGATSTDSFQCLILAFEKLPLKEMVRFVPRDFYCLLGGDQWTQGPRANPIVASVDPTGNWEIGVTFWVVPIVAGWADPPSLCPNQSLTLCSLEGVVSWRPSVDSFSISGAASPLLMESGWSISIPTQSLSECIETIIIAVWMSLRTPTWPTLSQHSDHMVFPIGFQYPLGGESDWKEMQELMQNIE